MTEDDAPLPLMARLIVAADRGDYARAARAQELLRQLGWHVSRVQEQRQTAAPRNRRKREASE